jgi:ssDNA-binding Zn-finger/Zn-ribbon topoisomerase 1
MEDINASKQEVKWKERADALLEQLLSNAPKCPAHGIAMEIKSSQRGTMFWGCPRYNNRKSCREIKWFGKREKKLREDMKIARREGMEPAPGYGS